MASDSLSTLTLEPDDWLDDPETAIGALSAAVATGEVCVDASGPRMLPAQVLQMLISARKSVEAQGGRFVLRAPSDGVVRSLTVLGCADYFEGGFAMTALSVLAIDDSRTMRMMVTAALENAGFDVVTADDGVQGVEAFGQRRFDAVITDINMPNLDGFGVIEAIRSAPKNRRVPVLVLTTESSDEFRNRARSLGATGWLVKPFEEAGLVNTVRIVTGQDVA